MLNWLATALSSNARERDKMRPDRQKVATDGFMVNVACVSGFALYPGVWGRLKLLFLGGPDC